MCRKTAFYFPGRLGRTLPIPAIGPALGLKQQPAWQQSMKQLMKPYGFATVLGEKGKRLSGGQQQRVAIARALVKEPPLLLFDDVFSALDYNTQAELLSHMRQFVHGRTVLIVSQRIAAVKEVDTILVIHQGTVAEQGTHQELVDKRGLYYQLYEQQLVTGEP